ncbi:unnamed protein product [Protopolystoma xenopodis]|uniref:Uncharacterized protein n=1 Tax=Protopolystoma xenopodis TaxID=117903 RepID=A0A448XPB9_9PLAT|nr:unnamed protein product [Protopolystoma xenopodis]
MLCGLPCSGKSTVCRLLVEELQSLAKARGRAVDCITVEEFAGADVHSTDGYNPRAVVFSDSHREREMRSRLKSDLTIPRQG